MPNGELHDLPSAPVPSPTARSFRLPADYYSAPRAEVRPIFPKWVPWGCGSAAALFLVLLFVGGAVMASGGFTGFIAFIVEWTVHELDPLYTKDVAEPERKALQAELDRFVKNISAGRIPLPKLQPVLQAISDVAKDGKVEPPEVDRLMTAARAANAAAK